MDIQTFKISLHESDFETFMNFTIWIWICIPQIFQRILDWILYILAIENLCMQTNFSIYQLLCKNYFFLLQDLKYQTKDVVEQDQWKYCFCATKSILLHAKIHLLIFFGIVTIQQKKLTKLLLINCQEHTLSNLFNSRCFYNILSNCFALCKKHKKN